MPSSEVQGRTWAYKTAAHSSVHTWVSCPPEACFDYVADFTRHSEWATNRVEITPVDPTQKGLGSRDKAVGHQAGKDWPSELEVTVYDRPSTFEFTASGGPIGTPEDDPHRHTFTFTPEDSGTADRVDSARPLATGLVEVEARSHPRHRSTHHRDQKVNSREPEDPTCGAGGLSGLSATGLITSGRSEPDG